MLTRIPRAPKKFIVALPFGYVKLAALFSGGKDSTFALYIIQQRGWEVSHLVAIIPKENSPMFHHPNIRLTEQLGEALGIPLVARESEEGETEELDTLREILEGLRDSEGLDGVITGAIRSDYQWSRINGVCEDLGLKTFSPLWRRDGKMLLLDMLKAGFEIIIVGASAEGLDSSWLGRKLDKMALCDLLELSEKHGINVSGEGGEYETLVLDGPNFKSMLRVDEMQVDWRRDCGTLTVKKASLAEKSNLR
jgi:ABC transporter with metal-binding/Fe-S-binding domain ATP-binding protein